MLEGATWGLLSNGTANERKQVRPLTEAHVAGIVKSTNDRHEALPPGADIALSRMGTKDRIIG